MTEAQGVCTSLGPDVLFNVGGLIAVITGAGSGIGLMMAKTLEANGATVYIVGRRLDLLEIVAREAVHSKLIPIQGDISSKSDLERITSFIQASSGYINLLVANAGVSGPDLKALPQNSSLEDIQSFLWQTPSEAFSRTLEVNISATFFTSVAFLGLLDAGNRASNLRYKSQIITTSSITGFNRLVPSGFAYGASKAAVTQMTKQLSTFLAPHGIRCNVIAPGVFPSEMTDLKKFGATINSTEIPAMRTGDEMDIAGAILFLASRAGAYCNGNVLVLDGGRLGITPSSY